MKIAILNPWTRSAETELQQRIKIAANNIGIEIQSFMKNTDIEAWSPDMVLSLSIAHAKATRYMTALAFWTPIARVMMDPKFMTSISSFDILLTPTEELANYSKELMSSCRKPYFDFRIWPSCYQTKIKGGVTPSSFLIYSGNNWDDRTDPSKSSIGDFFHYAHSLQGTNSDKLNFKIYGPADSWKDFPRLYQGSIPFDGTTFLNTYREAGVLLCLQSDKHYDEGIPSMRIFDACASGCLAICDELKFIKESYGDTVLYVDRHATTNELYEQIFEHLNWARENPKRTNEMVEAAQTIFNKHHALEATLTDFTQQFDELQYALGFKSYNPNTRQNDTIDVIIKVKDNSIERTKRALLSLHKQTFQSLRIIFIVHDNLMHVGSSLISICTELNLQHKIVQSSLTNETLNNDYLEALRSLTSRYFCILDNNEYAPNHFKMLVDLIRREKGTDVVYAGTTRVWEEESGVYSFSKEYLQKEIRKKQLCHPDDDQYLLLLEDYNEKEEHKEHCIGPGAWLARKSVLTGQLLDSLKIQRNDDFPQAFAAIAFKNKKIVFTWSNTCLWYWSKNLGNCQRLLKPDTNTKLSPNDMDLKTSDTKSHSPLISVILPFYNAQTTIDQCLESILSQSLTDFEIICINDKSPDDSQKIVEKYKAKDPRIVLLENDENIGLGATRNRGVQTAKGSFIFHIDPDDTIPTNSLKILYDHTIAYDSDMVKGSYILEQILFGQKTKKSIKSMCKDAPLIINTSLRKMPELLSNTTGHWSYLYKTSFAKKVPYPTDLKMGQDSIFLVHALTKAEKITVIDKIVYHYRKNVSSAMNTFNFRKYMDTLEWRKRAWQSLNEANLKSLGDRMLQSYWADAFFKNMPVILSKEEIVIFFKKYREAINEANIQAFNNKTSLFLKKLFQLIEKNSDDDAYWLLVNPIDITDDGTPMIYWNDNETTKLDSIKHYNKMRFQKDGHKSFKNRNTSLRVLTLSTFDSGGAGTGSQRRVAALREYELDARILSLVVRMLDIKHVGQIQPVFGPFTAGYKRAWNVVDEYAIQRPKNAPGYCASELWSMITSVVDMRQMESLIDQYDIIHLHWIVGMLDYIHMAEILENKAVVWTLADMNPFTGGCHYSNGCQEFMRECRECPQLGGQSNLAHEQWRIKKQAYDKLDIHFIFPSKWLAELASKSSLLAKKQLHVIPNAFPITQFLPVDKVKARRKLKLPLNKELILFAAASLTNHRKGYDLLQNGIKQFCTNFNSDNVEAIVFGNGNLNLEIPVHNLGYLTENESISLAYSAADVYVFPSREDNAPLTVAESLLCGTPVVGFPIGNLPEFIEHKKTGFFAEYLNVEDIAKGINWALNEVKINPHIKELCRQAAVNHHNPRISARRHQSLYHKILNKIEEKNKQEHFSENLTNNRIVSIGATSLPNKPKYYIVTPCRNAADTIDKTIRSIVAQAGDLEIYYYVNDRGSTDGTLDILKHWDSKITEGNTNINCHRVKFFWSCTSDQGKYDAIREAFDNMFVDVQDFMAWVNAGDILLPHALSTISRIIDAYPDLNWISGPKSAIEFDSSISLKDTPTPTTVIREGLCDGYHWDLLQNVVMFFKKGLWFKSKHALRGFKLAGDWSLCREFAKHAEYVECEKPLSAQTYFKINESTSYFNEYKKEINTELKVSYRTEAFARLRQNKNLQRYLIKMENSSGKAVLEEDQESVEIEFKKRMNRITMN